MIFVEKGEACYFVKFNVKMPDVLNLMRRTDEIKYDVMYVDSYDLDVMLNVNDYILMNVDSDILTVKNEGSVFPINKQVFLERIEVNMTGRVIKMNLV